MGHVRFPKEVKLFIPTLHYNHFYFDHVKGDHFTFKNAENKTIVVTKDFNVMIKRRVIKENNLKIYKKEKGKKKSHDREMA